MNLLPDNGFVVVSIDNNENKQSSIAAQCDGIDEIREEFERLRKVHDDNWSEVAVGLKEHHTTFEEDDPHLPLARYTKVDNRGPYRTDGNPSWPGGGCPRNNVLLPSTGRPCKVPSRG